VVTNSIVVGAYRHYSRRERERSATTAGWSPAPLGASLATSP